MSLAHIEANPNGWTKNRKKLCNEFWDDCAQKRCTFPCERIINAEKGEIMDSKEFYSLEWSTAYVLMKNMSLNDLRTLIAFAHGYIEQHKKGGNT